MIIVELSSKQQTKMLYLVFFCVFFFILYSVPKCLTCSAESSLLIDTEISWLNPSESLKSYLTCVIDRLVYIDTYSVYTFLPTLCN
jgi:hypothetical protein